MYIKWIMTAKRYLYNQIFCCNTLIKLKEVSHFRKTDNKKIMIPVGLILSSIFLSASNVPSTVPLLCKRTRLPGYHIYHLKPVYRISHNSTRVPSCASWANHFITTAHALLTKLKLPISRLPTSYSNKDQSERIWPLSLNFLQPGTIGKHRVLSMQTNPIQSVYQKCRSDFDTREGLEYYGTWARGPLWSLSPLSLAYCLGEKKELRWKQMLSWY